MELGLAEPEAVAVPVATEFCGLAEPVTVAGTLAPAVALVVPVGIAVPVPVAEADGDAVFVPFGL